MSKRDFVSSEVSQNSAIQNHPESAQRMMNNSSLDEINRINSLNTDNIPSHSALSYTI